jgi:hypothetical protein
MPKKPSALSLLREWVSENAGKISWILPECAGVQARQGKYGVFVRIWLKEDSDGEQSRPPNQPTLPLPWPLPQNQMTIKIGRRKTRESAAKDPC